MLRTNRVRGPKACMVIHQITMERAHAWLWHEKPEERQPTTAAQPPPATKFHRQPDFTPRAVGTWAAENRGGRMLCQAYQQNQCAGNSCSVGAHVCAMVVRDSGHVAAQSIEEDEKIIPAIAVSDVHCHEQPTKADQGITKGSEGPMGPKTEGSSRRCSLSIRGADVLRSSLFSAGTNCASPQSRRSRNSG